MILYMHSPYMVLPVCGAVSTGLFAAPRLVEITGVGKEGLFYGGASVSLAFSYWA